MASHNSAVANNVRAWCGRRASKNPIAAKAGTPDTHMSPNMAMVAGKDHMGIPSTVAPRELVNMSIGVGTIVAGIILPRPPIKASIARQLIQKS
jgi:hypothetical protein